MKKLICAKDVQTLAAGGQKVFHVECDTIVTPAAKDAAKTLGVEFSTGCPGISQTVCAESTQTQSCCENSGIDSDVLVNALKALTSSGLLSSLVSGVSDQPYEAECDKSGIKVVRGKTVQLVDFDTGIPTNKVYYQEVIGKEDSRMSAGFLVLDNSSFEWELFYDEIDYVLEGTLEVTINGKTITARSGDVLSVPTGSKVVWSSPNYAKVFYATYPANWPDLMPQ